MAAPCPACGAPQTGSSRLCGQCGAALAGAAPDSLSAREQRRLLRSTDFVAAARANRRNTRRLLIVLAAISAVLGYLCGWALQAGTQAVPYWDVSAFLSVSPWGITGAALMLGIHGLWTWIALWRGDRIIMRMAGARAVEPQQEPQLHNVVEEMALASGMPKPRVYILETEAMNAFATGLRPERASIGVTRGLLRRLTRDELQGVIGHEMAHIINWDIRYATIVSIMVGLIALVSDAVVRAMRHGALRGRARNRQEKGGEAGAAIVAMVLFVFALLAPLFAKLVQMAISRQREFLADATSVRLTRHPQGLISALEKLAHQAEPFKGANRATQHLFIVNPFRNFSDEAAALLATHPPVERRIQRLRNLGLDE